VINKLEEMTLDKEKSEMYEEDHENSQEDDVTNNERLIKPQKSDNAEGNEYNVETVAEDYGVNEEVNAEVNHGETFFFKKKKMMIKIKMKEM
jgi:hypothetical protein